MFYRRNATGDAVILDFRPKLENRCSIIVVTVENGPPAVVVAATRSASDSNFVAAKENGFACSGRSGNEVRVRF